MVHREKNSLPRALAINAVDSRFVAVSTTMGIRCDRRRPLARPPRAVMGQPAD
jgi:hypothetical protein